MWEAVARLAEGVTIEQARVEAGHDKHSEVGVASGPLPRSGHPEEGSNHEAVYTEKLTDGPGATQSPA